LSSVERLFGAILSVHEDCIRMSVGGSVFYHTAASETSVLKDVETACGRYSGL